MNLGKNRLLQFTQSKWGRYFAKTAVIAVAYCLASIVAISIQGVNSFAASVWPPAGIAQFALLWFGADFWPGILLGTLLFDLVQPNEVILLLSFAGKLGAILQALTAAFLLKLVGFRSSLERLVDVAKLIVLGGFVSTQVSCSLGSLSLCLSQKVAWEKYWLMRWHWWLGDAMGVIILTPLLLILCHNLSTRKDLLKAEISQNKYKITVWFFLLILVSWLVFGTKTSDYLARYPLEYIPFPLIIWAAIDFGQLGAVLASFFVSSIAIWGCSQGGGPFITKAENVSEALLLLQTFMGVITITSLLLAATVSERTAAENSLRKSEIKYRELVENANSIILKIDSHGNIIFFNEFAQKFFGYSESEILGQNVVGTIIPQTDTAGNDLKLMMDSILRNPEDYTHNENENSRYNGERVWVSWSNKPLFDAQNKLTGMLCIGTDITARKSAETALQKLNEELELRVAQRTKELQYQQEQSERLLLNILPEEIAERLKQGTSVIADNFADVTVLFADLVGFTKISDRISPSELVHLLNEIFSTFDQLAEKHGLEKIKTIGDAYMVVGGLPTPRSDHAIAIAEMALDMQQAISQFKTSSGEAFKIRIGINTGPVVAGVIGLKKFIYDLWGDTVNIASRMESQGLPGYIQVTEATYERLQKQYQLEKRGTIQVKGKGEMVTYFLQARRSISHK
ncbi:MAG: adenylate/guanylate cyclase domain-containing protein [Actinomycetota bacterium]